MRLEDEIGQKSFKSERQKGIVNLIYTTNWIISHQKEIFKDYGITYQQYNILRILRGQHPSPSTINTLKERMLDKMSDASRLVDRLVSKNLVIRQTNKNDKRAVDIIITDEGLKLLSKTDPVAEEMDSLLDSLSDEEVKILNDILDKARNQ